MNINDMTQRDYSTAIKILYPNIASCSVTTDLQILDIYDKDRNEIIIDPMPTKQQLYDALTSHNAQLKKYEDIKELERQITQRHIRSATIFNDQYAIDHITNIETQIQVIRDTL